MQQEQKLAEEILTELSRARRKLLPARDMRPDERQAVKRLAIQLLRQRVQRMGEK